VTPPCLPIVALHFDGTGCSSLGGGLFSEHGPFRPTGPPDNTTLMPNPWTWTLVANVLYLESPAGVGFSYSNTTADYTVGDERTREDVYIALQGFFDTFPALRSNPLWVRALPVGATQT
jgi:serine carboxypeptidase-like clade II